MLRIRVTRSVEELLRQAAGLEHEAFSAWMRSVLTREAKKVIRRERTEEG